MRPTLNQRMLRASGAGHPPRRLTTGRMPHCRRFAGYGRAEWRPGQPGTLGHLTARRGDGILPLTLDASGSPAGGPCADRSLDVRTLAARRVSRHLVRAGGPRRSKLAPALLVSPSSWPRCRPTGAIRAHRVGACGGGARLPDWKLRELAPARLWRPLAAVAHRARAAPSAAPLIGARLLAVARPGGRLMPTAAAAHASPL